MKYYVRRYQAKNVVSRLPYTLGPGLFTNYSGQPEHFLSTIGTRLRMIVVVKLFTKTEWEF